MATDTGIVIIYDLQNEGKPLTTHRVDAREFLSHPSGRWSTSPVEKKAAIGDAEGKETNDDNGEAMRLKEMNFKTLQGMANKAGFGWREIRKMNKAALVDALLAIEIPAPIVVDEPTAEVVEKI